MARWVWPTTAGVMTSLIGIVINLATEWKLNPWAWVCLAVLTGLGVVAAIKAQATPTPPQAQPQQQQPDLPPQPAKPAPTRGGVHNEIRGTVRGPVIQAGSIGSYNDHSVHQTAIARENSTIHQAGRDIRSDDAE
jgi:hypothetical protein